MKFLVLAVMSLVSSFAFAAAPADEPCANFAKYFAIRDYHKSYEVVQGSEGIQYESELISTYKNDWKYEVQITDNNEDGEYWTVKYEVDLTHNPNTNKCTLENIKSEYQEP